MGLKRVDPTFMEMALATELFASHLNSLHIKNLLSQVLLIFGWMPPGVWWSVAQTVSIQRTAGGVTLNPKAMFKIRDVSLSWKNFLFKE